MNSNHSVTSIYKRLEGKVALITGGASGIGASIVRLFVQHGAKVLIVDVQDELGQSLCQEFASQEEEETISYVHCDVTSDSDVQNIIDMAVSKYGKLDIMFNTTGILGRTTKLSILDSENEDLKRVFDVNVYGGFLGAKHASRVMIPANKGCIIFNASLASILYDDLPHTYIVSKNAVVGLAKNLCVELGQHGIRGNSISPSAVVTPLLTNALGLKKKEVEDLFSSAATLKGVVLEAKDIAQAALYLASDELKYARRVNLVVDGGYSLTNLGFLMALKSLKFP